MKELEKEEKLIIYGDWLSQPFRACMCLFMKESLKIGNWEQKDMLLFGSNERF